MVWGRRAAFQDRPSHLNRGYLAVCSAARLPAIREVKPTKINLSLFGRLLGALEGADHVDLIEGAIGSEVDDDRKAEGKHHGKHVAQRLDFDVKVQ